MGESFISSNIKGGIEIKFLALYVVVEPSTRSVNDLMVVTDMVYVMVGTGSAL